MKRVRALDQIAKERGQSLAQMAIAWVLRNRSVTSALIGARNVEQLDNSLDALKQLEFTTAELMEINRYAQDAESTFGNTPANPPRSMDIPSQGTKYFQT